MKNILKITSAALILGGLLFTTACSEDFLNEVKKDAMTTGYLDTPEGLASMGQSLYRQYRNLFDGEQSYTYTLYGTDEFMVAGDQCNSLWNDYDARLSPTTTGPANYVSNSRYWDHYYQWIARCNTIIGKADVLEGSPLKNETLGLAYFTRAFDYMTLVIQYGDIPLVTEPITKPEREFVKASREDIYKQIISDLENAYSMLPADASLAKDSYATKYAAAHYLAQAHLWRASETNSDWNSSYVESDLQKVITYANEVIAAHPLAEDFNDLYNKLTAYDTSITETNTEIVFSVGNSDADTTLRWQNWGLALFTAWYQGFPLMQREVSAAREYQRLKTTPSYGYFIYDIENDSRFWKSFKTTYAVSQNNKLKEIIVDGQKHNPVDYFPSNLGEYLGAMYIINRPEYGQKYYKSEVNVDKAPTNPSFTREDYATGKKIPTINALYIYDNAGNVVGTSMTPDYNTLYAPVCKHLDGAVNTNNLGGGYRDGIIARSAEAYFFKAEALIRQKKYDEGIAVLQPLRDRAEYKAGEERDAYVDGGAAWLSNPYRESLSKFKEVSAFYPRNSYYYSLGGWDDEAVREATNAKASELPAVTLANMPAEDLYVINKLKLTSDYDKALCYLLNEKSREMYGEYKRWMDLARTKTLASRLIFNDQANSSKLVDITGNTADVNGNAYAEITTGGSFRENTHYLRPIPQSYLDNITKDGKPLTADEKAAMQNPGY